MATPNRLPSRGNAASGPAQEGTLREIKQAVDRIADAMGDDVDVSSLAKESTLREGVNALESVIAPAGTPAVPALNVNVVETVGGGGGGGDATAANQVTGNTTLANILAALGLPLPLPTGAATQVTLLDILNKLIAAPATEAKQDAAIALLTAIDGALGGALTINLPPGISTEAKQDAIITAVNAVTAALGGTLAISAAALPLPAGASTSALQGSNGIILANILSALSGTLSVSAATLPLPTGAATELTLAAVLTALGAPPLPPDAATETTLAAVLTALTAPIAITGTVAIDQTTPGTTNAVEVIQVPAIVKGTQGTRGLSVQPLRDAGRTSVVYRTGLSLSAIGGFTSDTEYASGSIVKVTGGGVVGSAATSHVIPAGKTFRVQSLNAYMRVQTTSPVVTTAQVGLLIEPTGTVTSASPLALLVRMGGAATAGLSDHANCSIPEGFDIIGDGTLAIGIYMRTNFPSGSGPVIQVQLVGYEF